MTIFNYTVNYIDIALVAIVIAAMIIGYHRGLIINIVRFVRAAVGTFLCFFLSNHLAVPLYETKIKQNLLEAINQQIVTTTNMDTTMKNLNDYVATLPEFIAKNIDTTALKLSSADVAQAILTNVFEPIVMVLLKVAIFIATFIVFFGITGIIILVAQRVSKKRDEKRGKQTVVKKTDKLLGMLFGLLKSFIIVLAVSAALMYILSVQEDAAPLSGFMTEVSQSTLMKLLDSINPFNAITEGLL